MTIGSKLMMFTARPLVKLFGKSTKSGAETTIHCACSEEVTKQSGLYFEYDLINYIFTWVGKKLNSCSVN
jgi:hypothetical protein